MGSPSLSLVIVALRADQRVRCRLRQQRSKKFVAGVNRRAKREIECQSANYFVAMNEGQRKMRVHHCNP